jgi:cell division protein ZapA
MKEIALEIYGHTYRIRTSLDPGYLTELAAIVDQRMRTLARETETLEPDRIAILAALNLADEAQELKHQLSTQSSPSLPRELAQRLEECNRRLEAVLASTG